MVNQSQLDLQAEYWQCVKKEKSRFEELGVAFATEYLSAFSVPARILAELRITDNSPKYKAAKQIVFERTGKEYFKNYKGKNY